MLIVNLNHFGVNDKNTRWRVSNAGFWDSVVVTRNHRSVDYSSTGEYILSASTDGTLKMWDTSEEGGATKSYFDAGSSTWVKVRNYSLNPNLGATLQHG